MHVHPRCRDRAVIAILFASAAIAQAPAAEWTPTGGPGGGAIDGVVGDGAGIVAGAGGLLFRSSDGGQTWTAAGPGVPHGRSATPAAMLGDLIIATVTDPAELYVSTDGGTSWSATSLVAAEVQAHHVFQLEELAAVRVDPVDGGQRLFLTADGASWNEVPVPIAFGTVFEHGGAIYITTFGALWRTSDLGASWRELPALPNSDGHAFIGATSDAIIMRAVFGSGWLRSLNGGASWQSLFPGGLPGGSMPARAAIGDALFGIVGQQVYRSIDDGSTWTQLSGATTPVAVTSLWAVGSTLFVSPVSEGGLWRSADHGATWSFASSGINAATIGALGSAGGALFASPLDGSSSQRSADRGASWQIMNDLTGVEVESYVELDEDSALAGTVSGGVFRTDDAGLTWQAASNGLPFVSPGIFEPINAFARVGDAIFAGTGGAFRFIADGSHCACSGTTSGDGVYRTTNGGASWQRVSNGLPINTFDGGEVILRPIISLTARGGTLLAATALHGVWRSTSLGATWAPTSGLPAGAGTPQVRAHELLATDSAVYLVAESSSAGGPLYRSLDDGATWSGVPSTLQSSGGFSNIALLDGELYLSGELLNGATPGVYRSADGGATWSAAGAELQQVVVSDLTVADGRLYAAPIGVGVWSFEPAPGAPDADVTGDGVVDVNDLVAVILAWGTACQGCAEDIDGDGTVEVDDLVAVLVGWS